jgi:hypothetical protein
MCKCGCDSCETKSTALVLNENKAPKTILSEGLKFHMDNNRPLTEHLYRAGSQEYFNLFAEARSLYSRGILEVIGDDKEILTETDLGHYGLLEQTYKVSKRRAGAELKQKLKGVRSDGFGKYEGTVYGLDNNGKRVELKSLNDLNKYNKFELNENKKVPLDYPIQLNEMDYDEVAQSEFGMDYDQLGPGEKEWVRDEIDNMSLQEAKKKKKKGKNANKPIGKPMRSSSGGKAYKVYVKDPKTKKVKTVRFGSGGLRAKINDSKARAAFAKRHKCSQKKDRTKAGYWSCRLPRYAKLLGLKSSFSGFW